MSNESSAMTIGATVSAALEPPKRRVELFGNPEWLSNFSEKPDPRADVEKIMAVGLRETIRMCVQGKSDWPLFLYGRAGTGKTKACEALIKMVGGWMTTIPALQRKLTDADNGLLWSNHCGIGHKYTQRDVWEEIKTVHLLVIDEIGLRQPSDSQFETLKTVLDWRVDRNTVPTILVSNLGPDGLRAVYDDRILSRMTCGSVLEVKGRDLRMVAN